MTNITSVHQVNETTHESGPPPGEARSSSDASRLSPRIEDHSTIAWYGRNASVNVTPTDAITRYESEHAKRSANSPASSCAMSKEALDASKLLNRGRLSARGDISVAGDSGLGRLSSKRRADASPSSSPATPEEVLHHPRQRRRRLNACSSVPATSCTVTFDQPRKRRFNLFNALLARSDILLALVAHLPIETLLNLYAVSRPFHFLLNSHYTTYILASARVYAPLATKVFPFKCYGNLCINDPARRQNVERRNEVRKVPSFRWLKMVAFRNQCIAEILALLAIEGHRLPKASEEVLGKIWFTMDVPSNANRIGLLHNKKYWSDRDLFIATMFFIKLDMRFTDPVDGDGNGGPALRKLLLGQRSLSAMWTALKRTGLKTKLDVLRMWIRYSYEPAERHKGLPIFGVPPEEVGKLQLEGWGKGKDRLLRIDELVMREGIRRRLNLQRQYMDMMIWGYIDQNTFEDIPTPVLRKTKDAHEAVGPSQSMKMKEEKRDVSGGGQDPGVGDMMKRAS